MGDKLPRILPKVATSMSLLGSFTCRKFRTWDRRLYFPSEGKIYLPRIITLRKSPLSDKVCLCVFVILTINTIMSLKNI